MDYPRPCGCKGCRTCLVCEKTYQIQKENLYDKFSVLKSYIYCPQCDKVFPGDLSWNCDRIIKDHDIGHADNTGFAFPGLLVQLDFISTEEEETLINGFDSLPWDGSQSGRRKQNYGPKTNFKKMKIKPGDFRGFPLYSKFIQDRFEDVHLLKGFYTIEQCSLEYDPVKGASIDPHIDDCWIWGERVVTVNCLSDSVLTLTRYRGDTQRYNLPQVEKYRNRLIPQQPTTTSDAASPFDEDLVTIRVPMPRRSLIVLYGAPRYDWEHSVLREDIAERRVCIAYREFTPPYLDELAEEYNSSGKEILAIGGNFWSTSPETVAGAE